MLAPRAAYLAGAIVGLVTGIAYVISFGALLAMTTTDAASAASADAGVLFALLLSPAFGLFVGAFAGFYRRFLRLSGPRAATQNRARKVDGRARSR
jgi:hypothetical protein